MNPLIMLGMAGAYFWWKRRKQPASEEEAAQNNPAVTIAVQHFMLTISCIVSFVLSVLPFFPGLLAAIGRTTLLLSAGACVYTLYTNYPVKWPEIKSTWREYFAKVSVVPDFQFLYFSALFLSSSAPAPVFLILGRRSFLSAGQFGEKYLSTHARWKQIEPYWKQFKARKAEIDLGCVVMEQSIGLMFLVMLFFPSRQVMLTFLYWYYLKVRWMSPRSRPLQNDGWVALERPVAKVTQSRVGQMALTPVKKWFCAGE